MFRPEPFPFVLAAARAVVHRKMLENLPEDRLSRSAVDRLSGLLRMCSSAFRVHVWVELCCGACEVALLYAAADLAWGPAELGLDDPHAAVLSAGAPGELSSLLVTQAESEVIQDDVTRSVYRSLRAAGLSRRAALAVAPAIASRPDDQSSS